ncbi:MAG: hypothetical protein CBD18_06045 [Opitutales bacterium TMED158]|nr:MAG: hypothetical protein CBD18_06045 [Opitutales bacterium TMED158]
MIRNDYIMQMIQQIGALVARIMNRELTQDAMRSELDALTSQWIGLPIEVLLSLPEDYVFSLFEDSDRMVIEKSYLMGEVLRAQGVVAESDEARAEFFAKARFFFEKCSGLVDDPLQQAIDDRLGELKETQEGELD